MLSLEILKCSLNLAPHMCFTKETIWHPYCYCHDNSFAAGAKIPSFVLKQEPSTPISWCGAKFQEQCFNIVWFQKISMPPPQRELEITASFSLIYSQHLIIWGSCYCKKTTNKLMPVFHVSVLLLIINFVITLTKFTAEPLVCSLWFHSHFDNVMT